MSVRAWARRAAFLLGCVANVAALATPARAVVYDGVPDLALAARVVAAGTDGGTFHARTLFGRAFGNAWDAERIRLVARFGEQRVRDCFFVFDYAIDDALRIVARDRVPMPAPAADGAPLGDALWRAGRTPAGRYDVGYMLEKLITHPYHHEIMLDLDRRFGHATDASFHIVLARAIADAHRMLAERGSASRA